MKTEVRNEFILEAHKLASNEWKLKIEKECPKLFEIKLEVGKWYKEPSDLGNKYRFIFIEKIDYEKIFGYGFKGDGEWFENYYYHTKGVWKPVTEEEVKEALIKEAKKRGFKKGTKIKDAYFNDINYVDRNDFKYYAGLNRLQSKSVVFEKGKWAEIISNPIEEKIKEIEANIEKVVTESKKQINELKKQL